MQDEEKMIQIDEMSILLGVSINAFRMKLYKDPKIPRYKIGGSLRFRKNEVLEYFRFPKEGKAVTNEK